MKSLAQITRLMLPLVLITLPVIPAPTAKDYSLKLSRPGQAVQLEVEVRFGSIVIEGFNGDTVEVQAVFKDLKEGKFSKPEDMELIEQKSYQRSWDNENKSKPRPSDGLKRVPNSSFHLDIREENNEVDISSDTQNRLIELRIKVPKKSSVEASIYAGGDISVSNLTGALELSNHRGGVTAIDIDGPIVAETWRSDIVIDYAAFDSEFPSSFTTHHGNIDITVPEKSAKANLSVQSYRGEILSGLKAEFIPSDEVRKNDKGHQEITLGGAMMAKLNGGGQSIIAQTYSGNIYVRRGN